MACSVAALLAAWVANPLAASTGMTLSFSEVASIYNTALFHRYHKAIGRSVQSVCYVDFDVPGSMGCTGLPGGTKRVDSSKLRDGAKRQAKSQCKKRGGKRCRQFWRNDELKSDRLTGEALVKLEALLGYEGSHETEGAPLPDGVALGKQVLDSFEGTRTAIKAHAASLGGRNVHYAICGSELGVWTVFFGVGEGVETEHMRNLCVVKCEGLLRWYGADGSCFSLYEDDKFASEAARRALVD